MTRQGRRDRPEVIKDRRQQRGRKAKLKTREIAGDWNDEPKGQGDRRRTRPKSRASQRADTLFELGVWREDGNKKRKHIRKEGDKKPVARRKGKREGQLDDFAFSGYRELMVEDHTKAKGKKWGKGKGKKDQKRSAKGATPDELLQKEIVAYHSRGSPRNNQGHKPRIASDDEDASPRRPDPESSSAMPTSFTLPMTPIVSTPVSHSFGAGHRQSFVMESDDLSHGEDEPCEIGTTRTVENRPVTIIKPADVVKANRSPEEQKLCEESESTSKEKVATVKIPTRPSTLRRYFSKDRRPADLPPWRYAERGLSLVDNDALVIGREDLLYGSIADLNGPINELLTERMDGHLRQTLNSWKMTPRDKKLLYGLEWLDTTAWLPRMDGGKKSKNATKTGIGKGVMCFICGSIDHSYMDCPVPVCDSCGDNHSSHVCRVSNERCRECRNVGHSHSPEQPCLRRLTRFMPVTNPITCLLCGQLNCDCVFPASDPKARRRY